MISTLVALALAAAPISVNYRGTLGEALNEIASKGGINLIATGDLHVPAEVHLQDVTAEEALDALVKVHHLDLHREGKVWVVKPHDASTPAAPATAPTPPPPTAPIPPLPVPGVPAVGPPATAERIDAEAEAAEQRAEEARQRADEARERAERIRDAKEAAADANESEEQARLDEARAAIEEAKAKAKDIKHGSNKVSTGPVVVPDGEHVDDVLSYGGSVTLGHGVVADGDVVAFGGDVKLGDGAIVNGDAVSFGGSIKKGDGAVVKGEEVSFGGTGMGVKTLTKTLPVVKEVHDTEKRSGVAWFLIFFASLFGVGFLLMMLAPNRMRNIEAEIRAQPVKSGLAGLLAFVGSVPLTLLLVPTLFGPLLLWAVGGATTVMGLVALANALGARVPLARLRRTQAAILATGLLLMMLVFEIPVLGWIVLFAEMCVAFGAIVRTRIGQRSLGLPVPESPIHEVGA